MITENFLNQCYTLVFYSGDNKILRSKTIYRDIVDIIEFYGNQNKIEIPLMVKNKTTCLKKICELKLDDKENSYITESVLAGEKYKDFCDFLGEKQKENITDEQLLKIIDEVKVRRKLTFVLSNYDELAKFLETVRSGSFESADDIVSKYDEVIKTQYLDLIDAGRDQQVQSLTEMDLIEDDWSPVADQIIYRSSKVSCIPSGFPILDEEVLNGGFEPSRLYIIGGASGAGKSTLLLNCFMNACQNPANIESDEVKVYLYVTLENLMDETMIRLCASHFGKSSSLVTKDFIRDKGILERQLKEDLKRYKCRPVMKHFYPMTLGVLDLEVYLNTLLTKYGKGSVKALYLDYLDLLKSDRTIDIFRLELSFITMALRNLAVEYKIPVITGSQLSKGAYTIRDANDLNIGQMSESMKKVEHADFVSLMAQDPQNLDVIHMKVGKNRGGKSGMALEFKVNFESYRFLNGYKVSANSARNVPSGVMDTLKLTKENEANIMAF